MSKKPIFPFKNKPTSTSLDALTTIDVEKPEVKHFFINFTEGNFFLSTS